MKEVIHVPPIPPRAPETHKGTYGRVLLVAGAPGMAGAAVLAARAALRSGAGLVTAAIPRSLSSVLAAAVPEATQLLLPEDRDAVSVLEAACVGEAARGYDSIAIGPGLGTSQRSGELVAWLLHHDIAPQVVDADALNVIASRPVLASRRSPRRVWTPHPGEFQRLTGESPRGDAERLAAVERAVGRLGGVVLLKGHRSVIADDERYAFNRTGNPGMATGGSGDVLTGILAGLLAQGFEAFEAGVLGAHLHGLAGDLARNDLGELSLIAGDLVDYLPAAIVAHQRETAS